MGEHSGRVTIRPIRPEDIDTLIDEPLPYRVRAIVGERDDGVIIGWGGVAFPPKGDPFLFVDLRDGWAHPITLHKAAKRFMKNLGVPRAMATVEVDDTRAIRWAEAFQFKDTGARVDGKRIYLWQK